MKVLGSAFQLATAPLVLLASPLAAQDVGPASSKRMNTTGPTVAQFREAPITEDAEKAGGVPGPIKKGSFTDNQYDLPNGSIVAFAKCGEDQRCDIVAFAHEISCPSPSAEEEVKSILFVVNQMYAGALHEHFQIGRTNQGKCFLMQRFILNNGWTPETLHGTYFVTFKAALKQVRTKFP